MKVKSNCAHDIENPDRLGRAHYVCRHCGADISLFVTMLEDVKQRSAHTEIMQALQNKSDKPKRGLWAPGNYTSRCHVCEKLFIGDKRAITCAECEYPEDK